MEDKKQYILKNVGKLYLKFGIRSVTMDDVAHEFGISKKTLYQNFSDKEDLVSQVIDYYLKNPVFNLNKKCSGNSIDRIFALRSHVTKILKHFNNNLELDLKKQYPHLYKKVHDFKRQRIFNDTVKNIKEGKREGLFKQELEPEFVAKLQVGRMLYTLNPDNEIFDESEVMSIELFDKVMDYHMSAICTSEGLKYYRKQKNKYQNEEQS